MLEENNDLYVKLIFVSKQYKELVELLKQYKKVLEIIKKKDVDIDFLKSAETLDEYNKLIKFKTLFAIALTQEEFDLLKKWI